MDSNEAVNHPRHYLRKLDPLTEYVRGAIIEDVDGINIECFEAMVSMLTIEQLRGYLRGNSFKYRWRYTEKNGTEDLRKAEWYEKRLLKLEQALEEFKVTN